MNAIKSEVVKLYTVSMEVTAVVLATSERDAEAVFRYNQGDILSANGADICSDGEVLKEADLPEGWSVDCLPYGGKDDRTIGQWLDLAEPPVIRDTKTIDMFAGAPA